MPGEFLMSDIGVWVSIATAFAAVIGYAVRITWKIRSIEKDVRDEVKVDLDSLRKDVAEIVREHSERAEVLRHEFGETAAALRTKIHDVETWNRDTFVRKDSFEMVIGRIEKTIEKMGDKIEDRIEKLVDKIQHKND